MSTLEKAMNLLLEMPEQTLERVYAFMQMVSAQQKQPAPPSSAFGIAHKYADSALIAQEEGAFERAMAEKHDLG